MCGEMPLVTAGRMTDVPVDKPFLAQELLDHETNSEFDQAVSSAFDGRCSLLSCPGC